MKLALHARSLALVLVASAISSLVAEGQSLPAGQHREAALSVAGITGFGRGTLVMPGVLEGHLRVQLVDDDAVAEFDLDATLVPYAFLLDHTPAGAIEGLLVTAVDPESSIEGEPVAVVRGEWSVDAEGQGRLVAEFRSLDGNETLAPLGVLVGSFRLPPLPATIAPPLYGPQPIALESASTARLGRPVRAAAPSARGASPSGPGGGHAPQGGLEQRPNGPTIIVDSIPPAQVARVTVRWVLNG